MTSGSQHHLETRSDGKLLGLHPRPGVFQPALQGDCDAGQRARATALHRVRRHRRKAGRQHPGVVRQFPQSPGCGACGPHISWAPGDPAVGLPTVSPASASREIPRELGRGGGRLRASHPLRTPGQRSVACGTAWASGFPALNYSRWFLDLIPQLLATVCGHLLPQRPPLVPYGAGLGLTKGPVESLPPRSQGSRPSSAGLSLLVRGLEILSPFCGRETLAPRKCRVNPEHPIKGTRTQAPEDTCSLPP